MGLLWGVRWKGVVLATSGETVIVVGGQKTNWAVLESAMGTEHATQQGKQGVDREGEK